EGKVRLTSDGVGHADSFTLQSQKDGYRQGDKYCRDVPDFLQYECRTRSDQFRQSGSGLDAELRNQQCNGHEYQRLRLFGLCLIDQRCEECAESDDYRVEHRQKQDDTRPDGDLVGADQFSQYHDSKYYSMQPPVFP